MQVASAYDAYLAGLGVAEGHRVPRNALNNFCNDVVEWSRKGLLLKAKRAARKWHKQWLAEKHLGDEQPLDKVKIRQGRSGRQVVQWNRRQRQRGLQGKPHACPWVREQLFEWFVAMRYSIDWKECQAQLSRSRGRRKCLARFTRGLMHNKVQQLLQDYCLQCLVHGVKAEAFDPTPRWLMGLGI